MRINCPTSMTNPAAIAPLLDIINQHGSLKSTEARTKIFPKARAAISRWNEDKPDTHSEGHLYQYGLIEYVPGTDEEEFRLTFLGKRFLEIFEKKEGQINADGTKEKDKYVCITGLECAYNAILIDCLLTWKLAINGKVLHPGLLLLKLMIDHRLSGFLFEKEWAYVCDSDFADTLDYDAIVNELKYQRETNQEPHIESSGNTYAFLIAFSNSWQIFEKEVVDGKNKFLLSDITKSNLKSKMLEIESLAREEKGVISGNVIQDANDDVDDVFSFDLYGIHIKNENDALSNDRPHICIGWSKMGDLTDIETREQLNDLHEKTYPEATPNSRGQDVGQIHRFKNEAKIGDYVIFAEQTVCHIGRITSHYYYDLTKYPGQSDDYVNVRNVEWLKTNIKRSDLSEAFHNSLSASMSFWRLNDYKSAVNDLLNDTYVKDESLLIEEDIELDADDIGKDYTVAELAEILSEMYDEADNKTTAIHMFGFKYADVIINKGYNAAQIVKASKIQDSYHVEVNKGISIYKSVKDNEYGIRFYEPEETIQATAFDYTTISGDGINKIFYGVPGCGKSYHIEYNILGKDKLTKEYTGKYTKDNIIRTTFYQDYSNTDFVGQILPKIVKGKNGEKDTVEYIFNPGPFTLALIQAISNPDSKVALVVEEINRGNAPAIFGDIFQLLDRDENSISEYGIVNVGMIDYLNAYEFKVNGEKARYNFKEIKIPGNMDIFATMNTSDQNVYTLDTAFTRRWNKECIPNVFNGHKIENMFVPGLSNYTWGIFVDTINKQIRDNLESLQVNEDKQVGAFFVKEKDLLENSADSTEQKAKMFAYKVLEYLWADVSKLDHQVIFKPGYTTFEDIVKDFAKGMVVFNDKLGFKSSVAPITETE